MKYGKILEENIIEEYREFYINYKFLKQNISQEKDKFILLLSREVNKVEQFFLLHQEMITNTNDFCLFNLFSILKIVKKYHKKTNYDISDSVYNIYFKKSFYLHLMTRFSLTNSIQRIRKCSVCYDRNIYIFQTEECDLSVICNHCSREDTDYNKRQIIIALENITENTFNPFYLPMLEYPKRCILVGIDGLRPDCMLFATTPNIDKIIKNGVYNFDTQITTDSYSAPSWGAILSGYSQKILDINSNECVESDNFKWKTTNLFRRLQDKNICTYSVTSTWNGMKNLVQDSAIKSHHDKEFNVLKNDKSAIDEATTLLHDMKNNSFLFLYLNGVDYNGHKYGFSLQSKEYIQAIEQIDNYLEDLINICIRQHISLIFTTDHGGSKKSDLCNSTIDSFFQNKSLQPQRLYNGIHGLDCQQHTRVFQIYYGNIVQFQKKEDIDIESNLNIYKKLISYFEKN